MRTKLLLEEDDGSNPWKWPLTTDGILVDGKVDRDALVRYLVQVCTGRFLHMTTRPVGCSFTVIIGSEKREKIKFSLPTGPAKMLKLSFLFSITWDGPQGSGECSGNEQLFFDWPGR
jgi:hypothetical protein